MKLIAEYLEHALAFERLAADEGNPEIRVQFEEQAKAYRKLAAERAERMGCRRRARRRNDPYRLIRNLNRAVLSWGWDVWELRMSSPSIIPNDRLDRDFYIVLEDFSGGAAFRETDEGINYPTLIDYLLRGEYARVLRVVAFNPAEGWSRDASEDIARELERRVAAEGRELSEGLQDFIEDHLGRRIGVQLPLPLQI